MANDEKEKKKRNRTVNEYTDEMIESLADKLLEWIAIPSNFWIGKFCEENKIWPQRISSFADRNEKFNQALQLAKQAQTNRLVIGALANKLNVSMAIFALKNVAGWRDNQEEKKEDEELKKHELIFTVVKEAEPKKFGRFLSSNN